MSTSSERGGITVTLDVNEVADLPLHVTAVVFRSAQEIVRNVAAHANAAHVQLTATAVNGVARLVVEDDGTGFERADLDRQQTAGHIGLRSIGDLVASTGGRLDVRSAPGRGTRVTVEVPAADLTDGEPR